MEAQGLFGLSRDSDDAQNLDLRVGSEDRGKSALHFFLQEEDINRKPLNM